MLYCTPQRRDSLEALLISAEAQRVLHDTGRHVCLAEALQVGDVTEAPLHTI